MIGTLCPKGVMAYCHIICVYLVSSGLTNTATHAGMSSGLVVAIIIDHPCSNLNSTSLKNASSSFSSVSACAMVV